MPKKLQPYTNHIFPMPIQLPELLCPAGDMDRLDAALTYGANACYLGGKSLSLRAGTGGFDWNELAIACDKAHARGTSIYYTLNVLPHETHLSGITASLERLAESAVDGLIIADPGVLRMARRLAPQKSVHLSTQANTANSEAVGFWYDLGIRRVNLARELSARAMRELVRTFPDMEFEVFVHGAMCLALSGRCLLSAWLNKRPANLGECTHPCRFEYRATALSGRCHDCSDGSPEGYDEHGGQGKRPHMGDLRLGVEEKTRDEGTMWEVTREEPYSALWSPEDLCLVKYMPWFVRTGIASLKIEGRMKTPSYVAHVADTYRTALDDVAAGRFRPETYLFELRNTASRNLSTGFFLPDGNRISLPPLPAEERLPIVARIQEQISEDTWRVAVRSPWQNQRTIQVMQPGLRRPELAAGTYSFENHKGESCDQLHPGTEALLRCDSDVLAPGLFLR